MKQQEIRSWPFVWKAVSMGTTSKLKQYIVIIIILNYTIILMHALYWSSVSGVEIGLHAAGIWSASKSSASQPKIESNQYMQ
jgi:hypothetical protein